MEPRLNQEETPLTLDVLLSHSCSNPVDWQARQEHDETVVREWTNSKDPNKGPYPSYKGWNRYDITLHCTAWEIIARELGDGRYEVQQYHIQDH